MASAVTVIGTVLRGVLLGAHWMSRGGPGRRWALAEQALRARGRSCLPPGRGLGEEPPAPVVAAPRGRCATRHSMMARRSDQLPTSHQGSGPVWTMTSPPPPAAPREKDGAARLADAVLARAPRSAIRSLLVSLTRSRSSCAAGEGERQAGHAPRPARRAHRRLGAGAAGALGGRRCARGSRRRSLPTGVRAARAVTALVGAGEAPEDCPVPVKRPVACSRGSCRRAAGGCRGQRVRQRQREVHEHTSEGEASGEGLQRSNSRTRQGQLR